MTNQPTLTPSLTDASNQLVSDTVEAHDIHTKYVLDFQQVVSALAAKTCGFPQMATIAILTTTAASVQDSFLIQSPAGETKPLGMLFCLSAPSGTRKSTTLRHAMKPLHDHESRKYQVEAQERSEYLNLIKIFRLREDKLRKKIVNASAEEEKQLLSQLFELQRNEPKQPKSYLRMTSNSTMEGLLKRCDESRFSPVLVADEGRHAMTMLMNERSPQLCKLYDGDAFSTSRASVKSLNIQTPRITGIFMLQPELLSDYVAKHGNKSLGSGLWARILVLQIETANTLPPPVELQHPPETFDLFHHRIHALLDYADRVVSGEQQVGVLSLGYRATQRWHEFVSQGESSRRRNPSASDSTNAYLSRAPENLLRLAGLIHLIATGDATTPIQEYTMNCAIWYMNQFTQEHLRLFEFGGLDQDNIDVQKLMEKLLGNFRPGLRFTKTDVHRITPRCLRGKNQRLQAALDRLVGEGQLFEVSYFNPQTQKKQQIYSLSHSIYAMN